MAHDVDTLLVRCADPRYAQEGDFAEGLQELLAEAHAERHYLLTSLGGSLEFTRGQTTLGWLWRLEQARAFGMKRLLLVDHLDCGIWARESRSSGLLKGQFPAGPGYEQQQNGTCR